jgi:hypothetical protein
MSDAPVRYLGLPSLKNPGYPVIVDEQTHLLGPLARANWPGYSPQMATRLADAVDAGVVALMRKEARKQAREMRKAV